MSTVVTTTERDLPGSLRDLFCRIVRSGSQSARSVSGHFEMDLRIFIIFLAFLVFQVVLIQGCLTVHGIPAFSNVLLQSTNVRCLLKNPFN